MLSVWLIVLSLIALAHGSPTPTTVSLRARSSAGRPSTTFNVGSTATVITATVEALPSSLIFVVTGPPTSTTTVTTSTRVSTETWYPGYAYEGLNEQNTRESTSFVIDLTQLAKPVLCWYPISGNYCRLPRILFYVTIAAAVVLRRNLPWLYLGALAASLTYSGATAIHACLLVWHGPGWGELDLYAILAILSVSCIVMVPLLNWSSTIRNAGRPDLQHRVDRGEGQSSEEREDFEAASRVILIFWSFLVTVGFICAFVAFNDISPTARWGHWTGFAISGAQSLSCAPDSGVLNVTTGQPPVGLTNNGNLTFNFFIITKEFVDQNNCQSPCSDPVGGTALFRTQEDLVSLTEYQLYYVAAQQSDSASQAALTAFVDGYASQWSYVIIFVLVQGIWTVCFGRNTPSQMRNLLYEFFSRFPVTKGGSGRISTFQRRVSQVIALIAYAWSVFIVLVAIPLLVVNIFVIELYVSKLPQSESGVHIGAWSPYASTALALIAAALAKSYQPLKEMVKQSGGNVQKLVLNIRPSHRKRKHLNHGAYKDAALGMKNLLTAFIYFIFGAQIRKSISREWGGFLEFCRDPEESLEKSYQPVETRFCRCPADYECPLHPECSHHRVCDNRSGCGDCPTCYDPQSQRKCECSGEKGHFVKLPTTVGDGIEPKTGPTRVSTQPLPSSQDTSSSQAIPPHLEPELTQPESPQPLLQQQETSSSHDILPQLKPASTNPPPQSQDRLPNLEPTSTQSIPQQQNTSSSQGPVPQGETDPRQAINPPLSG